MNDGDREKRTETSPLLLRDVPEAAGDGFVFVDAPHDRWRRMAPDLSRCEILNKYCRLLTEEGYAGRLPPVFPRDPVIERLLVGMGRMETPHAVLVGENGVGKTWILFDLAERILRNRIHSLQGFQLGLLDANLLLENGRYRGGISQTWNALIQEAAEKGRGRVILCIDEMQSLIYQTSLEQEVAGLFKRDLGGDRCRFILISDSGGYIQLFGRDQALRRRTVKVEVPSMEEAGVRAVFEGVKRKALQAHHGVRLDLPLVDRAFALSRDLGDRSGQPAATVLLVDTAMSLVRKEGRSRIDESDLHLAFRFLAGTEGRMTVGSRLDRIQSLVTLGRDVVGRDRVIREIRTSLEALVDGRIRGPAVFLFVGATALGKSFLAGRIADHLDPTSPAVRVDGGQLMDRWSMTTLTGSPPGLIRSDEPALLTRHVNANPYTVFLFDEVEKAHASIWNLFLGLMDDGFLTDNHGVRGDFRRAVFFLTANCRERAGEPQIGFHGPVTQPEKPLIKEERDGMPGARDEPLNRILEKVFPDWFIRRIPANHVFEFGPLSAGDLTRVLENRVSDLARIHHMEIILPSPVKREVLRSLASSIRRFGVAPIDEWSRSLEAELIRCSAETGQSVRVGWRGGKPVIRKGRSNRR